MSLHSINFFGRSIGLCTSLTAIIPDAPPPAAGWPVLYLLHGLSDDHTIWQRRTSIERYLEGLPLVCIMPTTHRGWYTNAASPPGLAYEDHIIKDVLGLVENTFPVKKSRSGRAIGGLSMGGYGALKLALKFPDKFCSAHSHSGALLGPGWDTPDGIKSTRQFNPEFAAIFGPYNPDNDCLALLKKIPAKNRPALRIDCGTEDFLLADNRNFHLALKKQKVKHDYLEFPGAHNWQYWDTHIQSALAFHRKNLKIK